MWSNLRKMSLVSAEPTAEADSRENNMFFFSLLSEALGPLVAMFPSLLRVVSGEETQWAAVVMEAECVCDKNQGKSPNDPTRAKGKLDRRSEKVTLPVSSRTTDSLVPATFEPPVVGMVYRSLPRWGMMTVGVSKSTTGVVLS